MFQVWSEVSIVQGPGRRRKFGERSLHRNKHSSNGTAESNILVTMNTIFFSQEIIFRNRRFIDRLLILDMKVIAFVR